MDSDQGKVFVGGISWDTTEETLKDFFKVYGEVVDAVIMRDRMTGRARGFGFVGFADPSVVDRVLQEKHNINGRTVEVKRAVPRDEQQQNAHLLQRGGNTAGPRTKKIFVGGLASNVAEDDFRMYFEQFGKITDVVVMYDHATQRHRGFGFITFDSEDAVDKVLHKGFHELKEKMVEVKRAIPKESFPGTARAGSAYGQQGQRSFPGGGSGGGGFGARPDGRYGHPASAGRGGGGGGYPSYGAVPAYGAAGYGTAPGYGAGVNGGYGVAPGYGAAAPAYGGYGNAPANGGYGGGAAGYAGGYGGAPMGGKTGWAGGAPVSTAYSGYWGGSGQAQAAVPAASYGYGGSGYEAPASGGYGAPPAGGAAGGGGGGGAYSGGYGDMYSNSGYGGSYNPASGENA